MSKYFVFLIAVSLCGCAQLKVEANDPHYKAIEAYSDGDVEYEGAYNNFKYRATIQNESIQEAVIDKKASVYQWDGVKRQTELAKLQQDNATKTKVFLSFFTPTRQDDNLSTNKSIWAVYLTTSQGRYEGTVMKVRDNRTEVYSIYPYHQRYSSAYEVIFTVPLAQTQNEETTMTITGPLGNKTVKFPAKKSVY